MVKKEEKEGVLNLSDESQEALKSLEKSIQDLKANITFGSNAFKGNVEQIQDLMGSAYKSLSSDTQDLKQLLNTHKKIQKEFDDQIVTLSLLPLKTQDTLKKLVPDIGEEIEKLHSDRMEQIETTLGSLNDILNKTAEDNLKALRSTSDELVKKFDQSVSDQQKRLERIITGNAEKIRKNQLQQINQQTALLNQASNHTKKEIESVTSNHGSKFLRNTAICLVLAAITGSISGWYVNRYMPKFVTLEKTGDITIHHSNVKVLEAPKLEKNDLGVEAAEKENTISSKH